MTTFEKVAVVAYKLNRMPVSYTTGAGNKCETFYTTREMLENIVSKINSDNTIELEYRTLENSCLREMGFENLAVYIDRLSDGKIAIFGV